MNTILFGIVEKVTHHCADQPNDTALDISGGDRGLENIIET